MLWPHWWPVLPLMFIIITYYGVCYALINRVAPEIWIEAMLNAAIMVPVTFVAFLIVRIFVRGRRIRRFKREISDRLLPILDKRAAEQITTPSGARVAPG